MKIKILLLTASLSLMALPINGQAHQLHSDHHQYQHRHADHSPFQIIIEPFFYLPQIHYGHHYNRHNYRQHKKQHNGHRRQHRQHNPRPRHH
ncbi:MAG: hypothetical protein Q9O24_00975 [Gammaproteobacteria bacterium]|nr:hypothetical protein [Gammaproteobacteria bacterium]